MHTTKSTVSPVEALEARAMFSVSGNIDANNVMNVYATAGNDKLHVEFTYKAIKIYDTAKAAYGNGAPLLAQWGIKGTKAVRVYAGAGHDFVTTGGYAARPVHVFGGAGDDALVGGAYQDNLFGGAGHDYLQGNGGNDYLYGDAGNDSLVPDGKKTVYGNDFMSGGDGVDQVSYYYAKAGVTINMNNYYVSGIAGEKDCVYVDVENAVGSDFADRITGNALNNTLFGRAGDDWFLGLAGNDSLYGQAGNDTLSGSTGADLVVGGAGADLIFASGDAHVDTIWGGDKNVFADGEWDQAYVGKVGAVWDQVNGGVEKITNVL
ncbi:MAG TPA: calcium-binding protein [Tepidisphaeraceae bacterium]|nr:calcium-binding protein [Tepidisphaeraceae bacterium]